MTLYMPPLSKKKAVESKFNPDTNRIFSNYDAKQTTSAKSHNQSTHAGQRHPAGRKSRIIGPPCQNTPHPADVNFLIQDCRLLHEPICHVKTKVKIFSEDDKHWWPSRTSEEPHNIPICCESSTNRADFKKLDKVSPSPTRHGYNPHAAPSKGIVPVNHLPAQNGPRLLVERISYQHAYDSRKPSNLPQRGKLHGNFVWDVLHPVDPSSSRTSSNKWNRTNSFPWEASASPKAKMVQVSPTMAVLKPETSNNTRQKVVGLGATVDTSVAVASGSSLSAVTS
ncbi:uncharacterized protein [Amphiura filiformis]|uniref:uncharacterized protein n=1 Tax=Amphiura filiformis TaxID=82378 RepID=UPI003B21F099